MVTPPDNQPREGSCECGRVPPQRLLGASAASARAIFLHRAMPSEYLHFDEYSALQGTATRSNVVRLRSTVVVFAFVALSILIGTALLHAAGWKPPTVDDANGMSTSVFSLPSAQDGPPLLCYEFAATVTKSQILVQDGVELEAQLLNSRLRVAQSSDTVGTLMPAGPPFQKAFRSFWTTDSKLAGQDDSCVELEIEPFFSHAICDLFPAHHTDRGSNSSNSSSSKPRNGGSGTNHGEQRAGCSTHQIHKVMPLDASFGPIASHAYVGARRLGRSEGNEGEEGQEGQEREEQKEMRPTQQQPTTTPAVGDSMAEDPCDETWEWRGEERILEVKERGAVFNASVRSVVTYRLHRIGGGMDGWRALRQNSSLLRLM